MSPALLRIVYASRAHEASDAATRAADVRAILGTARAYNAAHGITGLLIVANGHFLQVLEGRFDAVEALYRKIDADARHREVSLLSRVETRARSFGAWSMGLIERTEPESATTARLKLLRDRLAADPSASAADFCRLMLAPSVNSPAATQPRPAPGGEPLSSVAFASPTGMWSAAVLQHVSSKAMRRAGRTSVIDPGDPSQRASIEYIDVELPGVGPLRAVSLAAGAGAFAPVAPLMERLSLLVFMMAPSDAEGFTAYVRAWLELPQVVSAAPRVLVLAGMAPERVAGTLQSLRAGTALTIEFASVKLSDSAAVWRAAQTRLRECAVIDSATSEPAPLGDRTRAPGGGRGAGVDIDLNAPVPANALSRAAVPCGAEPGEPADPLAELVAESGRLHELLELEGATAAALIDAQHGVALLTLALPGTAARSFADDAAFLRGKWQLATALLTDDQIEDIAMTTQSCMSIYRALPGRPTLFLAVAFERERAPLAMARMRLQDIAGALALLLI